MRSFVDANNNGLDKVCRSVRHLSSLLLLSILLTLVQVIPRTVLERAAGFAIFTVFKAGFLFSARAGSGVVVARLPDGSE